ncbi:MAG TPA: lactonase family protein [Silvibacterium sp.]|nr:lactonase family protein [Silvibacterium sp.]
MAMKVDRRKVIQGLAVSTFASRAWWAEAAEAGSGKTLFVGTQTGTASKGTYSCKWDPAKGELGLLGLAAEAENPTFLALSPDAKYLYAANEVDSFNGTKGGGVSAFTVDAKAGKLTAINAVSAMGAGTCHVEVDKTGQAVFCANYTGGSAASFHVLASGGLSEAVSHFQYSGHGPNAERQEAPHAHRVTVAPENKFVLVNDLGLDCIHIYKLDAATAVLTPSDPPQWTAAPGSGPRALRFHPNGRFAYCVHELISSVEVLRWDGAAGALTPIQEIKMTPDDYTKGDATGSEIVLDRTGRFAYAANRGVDQLVSFGVAPTTGKLTLLGRSSCGGQTPRHIALDPTERWLLVANQGSDGIAVFRRDTKTGLLAESGKAFPIVKPQCLVFV